MKFISAVEMHAKYLPAAVLISLRLIPGRRHRWILKNLPFTSDINYSEVAHILATANNLIEINRTGLTRRKSLITVEIKEKD